MYASFKPGFGFAITLLVLAFTVSSIPSPFLVEPTERWEGNDGKWSTFALKAGTPPQRIRVLPAITNQETWLVGPIGCTDTDPKDCGQRRGGLFFLNDSSTWNSTKSFGYPQYFDLGDAIGTSLGFDDGGEYGLETVSLSWNESTVAELRQTVVASIKTTNNYIGQFGLSPRRTNFTGKSHGQARFTTPSYLSLLKHNEIIPSLSWGFTPGSYYRTQYYKNALGSLVLGGYDKTRFTGEPLPFNFYPDTGRELVVAIRDIKKVTKNSTGESLINGSILAAIDSSHPNIWLPIEDCQLFKLAFDLSWNETAQMYFTNETTHSQLLRDNTTIVVTLADSRVANKTIDIHIPYGSFDLTADHPLVPSPRKYFPLKRAANYTQYTIGRAFLQEAYIIADYERQTFSIAQARWEDASPGQNIIAIMPVGTLKDKNKVKKIIGLSVGITILVIGIASLLVLLLRRRNRTRRKRALEHSQEVVQKEIEHRQLFEADSHAVIPNELDGQVSTLELDSGSGRSIIELPANPKYQC